MDTSVTKFWINGFNPMANITFTISKKDSITFANLNTGWQQIEEIESNNKDYFIYENINPFSPSTSFHWIMIDFDTLKVSLWDANMFRVGKEFKTFLDSGFYKMIFDDENCLESGVYFIKLEKSEGVFYKKFLLLR